MAKLVTFLICRPKKGRKRVNDGKGLDIPRFIGPDDERVVLEEDHGGKVHWRRMEMERYVKDRLV